jgi:ribosomal protein L31E
MISLGYLLSINLTNYFSDWLEHHPDAEHDPEYDQAATAHLARRARRAAANVTDFEMEPVQAEVVRIDHDLEEEVEPNFYAFRKLLVRHFKEAKERREVHWL